MNTKHLFKIAALAAAWLSVGAGSLPSAPVPLTLHPRNQVETRAGAGDWQPVERVSNLPPNKTAIVVCDMWDKHWCAGATRRVAEMAPRMNEVIGAARSRGVLIIHCPSDTMKFYADAPQRKLAQSAPKVAPKVPLLNWCHLDTKKESALPIDDSDGGCDDWPQCKNYPAWKQQIPVIDIQAGDAVTDSAEAYYLMEQRGIENVIVMGVHLNMCVLGRPFSIRQMVAQGKHVYLMRDMTDTMYNSRRRPYVPHCAGTDLMVAHVEKYWCPTIASTDIVGKPAFRFSEDRRPQVVFLIGEDEYKTWETLPAFARNELEWRGLTVSIIQQAEGNKHTFPGFAEAMREADLLLVSVRRRALPKEQLDAVRAHLAAGKPLIGIRTASHAFAPRSEDAALGDSWATFDPDVLGGNYVGHHGNDVRTTVSVAPDAAGNPLLQGVDTKQLVGNGSLYRVSPLRAGTTPLLMGSIADKPSEPIAWSNTYGEKKARIFYTSLGHPDDFGNGAFRRLLLNVILQSVGRPIPPAN